MKTLLAVIGIGLLAGALAQADIIAGPREPAKEQTLTGTLGWEVRKGMDGVERKVWLQLTTADSKVVKLVPGHAIEKPEQYDKLIGKQVVAKVLATSVPQLRVTKVNEIKAAP